MEAASSGVRDVAIWVRMMRWASAAISGVAVRPVPMAQTGS